jgi:hypothetical protein
MDEMPSKPRVVCMKSLWVGQMTKLTVRHGYPWVPTDQAHGLPRQVGPAY